MGAPLKGPDAGAVHNFAQLDPARVPSPCYVLDLAKLEENLVKLRGLGEAAGVKVLLALKAFSCFAVADLVGRYLAGTAASGLFEARLGKTRFGGEVHSYAPGLKAGDLAELLELSDHLILNSLGQYRRFAAGLSASSGCSLGLRVNPGHREVENPLYDPCAPWSRLGEPVQELTPEDLAPFEGLHVHGLCDHDYEPVARLLRVVEEKLSPLFGALSWLNLGGGALLTAPGFPLDRLAEDLAGLKRRSGLELYLEPGTAVALNAGALVCEVLDRSQRGGGRIAVTDTSATCHMPDVIEAGYTPDLLVPGGGAAEILPRGLERPPADDGGEVWRIGGPTCLAGDVIGTYRLPRAPEVGERLVFLDLAYYTMVKSTTFNGTPLPSIALWDSRSDELRVVKSFGYEDFEGRLS